jgi:Zn-dependent peptidase ImmA (M78 family)
MRESFGIEIEWEACPPLGDDGQRVTFGEVTLFCSGAALTRHADSVGVHDGVLVPTSSLATWITRSWHRLAGEERLFKAPHAQDAHEALRSLTATEWDAVEEETEAWLATHSLAKVGDGLILPSVLFWRRGAEFTLSWRADPEPGEREIQFITSGRASLPAATVLDVLRAFVELVAQRVNEADQNSAARAAIERTHPRMASGVGDLKLLAMRLGRTQESLGRWLGSAGSDVRAIRAKLADGYGLVVPESAALETTDVPIAMAARSASPFLTDGDHEVLLSLGKQAANAQATRKLADFRKRLRPSVGQGNDYALGYQRAYAVRALLHNTRGKIDVEAVLARLRCEVVDVHLDDRGTDGVVLWWSDGRAVVGANTSSPRTATPWGRRAMLAHELYHLLFDVPSRQVFGECLSDWTATPTEREANSFAAEFLIPASALPSGGQVWAKKEYVDVVAQLCNHYRVGWELVVRQLQNRKQLPQPLVDALLASPALRSESSNTAS